MSGQIDALHLIDRQERANQKALESSDFGKLDYSSDFVLKPSTAAQMWKAAVFLARAAMARHGCELDPKKGVTVCRREGHERDRAALTENLQAAGLIPADALPTAKEPAMPSRSPQHRARPIDVGWQNDAECIGYDLSLFFGIEGERGPDKEIRERRAKQVCLGCIVRSECREYALERKEKGVWGGLNEDERAAEKRRRSRKAAA